jgi:Fe-S-cluster-containing hydrogenase component 2
MAMEEYGVLEVRRENCVGCRMCEIVCSAAKEGRFIPSLARIQVIEEPLRGLSAPVVCLQCADPMCRRVCPAEAIAEIAGEGVCRRIEIDRDKCIACGRCAHACPIGAINYAPAAKARKCDLCAGDPQCAKYCYYDCLRYERLDAPGFRKRVKKVDSLINKACRKTAAAEIENRHRQALPETEPKTED